MKNNILSFKDLSKLKIINNNIIDHYYLKNWDWLYLLTNTDIKFKKNSCPLELIEKYPNRFKWGYMEYNPHIDDKFILKYRYKSWNLYNIPYILFFKKLSEFENIDGVIIDKYYLKNWDWLYLLKNTDIIFDKNSCPLELINEYPDRFYWPYMEYNPHVDDKFVLKHKDKEWNINEIIKLGILKFEKLSELKNINGNIISEYHLEDWNWEYLLINTNIVFLKNSCPLELVEKYPDRFNWYFMDENQHVIKKFILKHKDKNWDFNNIKNLYDISIKKLSKFKHINTSIINKYYTKNWNWEYLLTNTNIIFEKNSCPLELVEKYPDRFNWYFMSYNIMLNK